MQAICLAGKLEMKLMIPHELSITDRWQFTLVKFKHEELDMISVQFGECYNFTT